MASGWKRRLVEVVGACLLLFGCGSSIDLDQAHITVFLMTPLERNLVKDQKLMAVVQVDDASGAGIKGLKVRAKLHDAGGAAIQTLVCQTQEDRAGRYESLVFVPPAGAQSGDWQLEALVTHGEQTRSTSVTVYVDDTLGAQTLRQHGLFLPIPPSWSIIDQSNSQSEGRLVLDPMPEDTHLSRLEIRYLSGQADVTAEALREAMASYLPQGLDQADAYVKQIITVDIQGYPALLARGGLVGTQGTHDHNLALQSYRFYCPEIDRTYTVTMVSDADTLMSRMAAMLDGLRCASTQP